MAYIGRTPTGSILTSADIADGSISTDKIQDNAVTPAKYIEVPSFRNLIINGDMSIAQRGTSFSPTGDAYVLDRFKLDYAGSPAVRYTITQDTNVPTGQGFAKSMKFDVTTAEASPSATTRLWTRLEGQNLQQLKYGTSNAESLTLSFWVKSNLTGTFIFWLYQEDGSNRSISKSYTINSANTWEKKTITIDGDTSGQIDNDNGAGFRVVWYLTADQSAYGTSSLQTSWGSYDSTAVATGQTNVGSSTSNEWYITGVQLEVGTSASDFEFLPYDVNLQRCQRYFEILSIKQASQENEIMNMISFNASQIYGTYQFRTEKRNDPSLVVDNGTNYFRYYRQGGNENFSSIGLDNSSLHQASLYGTGLSLTSGEGGFVRWVNNASTNDKVAFDSEL